MELGMRLPMITSEAPGDTTYRTLGHNFVRNAGLIYSPVAGNGARLRYHLEVRGSHAITAKIASSLGVLLVSPGECCLPQKSAQLLWIEQTGVLHGVDE